MSVESTVRAVTTYRLTEMKQRGEKIAMLTSYDYSMAKIVDAAGVDVILVGDSAANVMAGYETTVPITLDMMIYHARSVARAVRRALMPVEVPDIIIFLPELPLNDRGKVDRHQLERVILKETATKACD